MTKFLAMSSYASIIALVWIAFTRERLGFVQTAFCFVLLCAVATIAGLGTQTKKEVTKDG